MAYLGLHHVEKRYKDVAAVNGVTLQVEEGEFFSLLGPSGCGKTTLLRLIAGFVTPSAGQIQIQGEDVTQLPPERRNMGMVFQSYALFPHMTVADNIAFGLRMRKLPPAELQPRVSDALNQVGLTGYGNRYPRHLSGGQQQRVALARVLVIRPRVLLLDEPLSALDKQLREQMQFWIKDLQHRLHITTIYVTHDQQEALTMSDRVAVMSTGRVEQVGTPREIYSQPRTRFVADFIGDCNTLAGEVAGLSDEWLDVKIGGHVIRARRLDGVHVGQQVTVAIRPENILLGGEAERSGLNCLIGRLRAETFRGALIRYDIDIPSGSASFSLEIYRTNSLGPVPSGVEIPVAWHPQHAVVIPEQFHSLAS